MHAEHAVGRFLHGGLTRACRVMAGVICSIAAGDELLKPISDYCNTESRQCPRACTAFGFALGWYGFHSRCCLPNSFWRIWTLSRIHLRGYIASRNWCMRNGRVGRDNLHIHRRTFLRSGRGNRRMDRIKNLAVASETLLLSRPKW